MSRREPMKMVNRKGIKMSCDIRYECECQRTNISPKSFYTYCRKQLAKKGVDLESWIAFEDWTDEKASPGFIDKSGFKEICDYRAYNTHLYFKGLYNFIMEFTFDSAKSGYGYMYAVEFI